MTIDLDTLTLAKGDHRGPDDGACLLEAVSYVAGEPWSDRPKCVSPILGTFGRSLNDILPDSKRQLLKPLIPDLIGTADDPAADQTRGLMAADWLIRVYTPAWLRLAKLDDAADSLETLPRQATWDDVAAAAPAVQEAKEQADAARDAARAAARDATRDAAGDAARAAARAAAWAAAWAAARDAAWDAAWAAARAAAWVAAWNAARDATRDAAWDALQPTVDALQDSAIKLFDAMVHLS